MFKEEREDVITNNNTAQEKFTAFVEQLSKPIKKVEILEPLYGDLNLNIFQDLNLGIPEEIYFQKGQITSFTNIPNGIKILSCPNNFLISIENLPTTLEKINLEYNFLENIDVSNLKFLEELNINHNQIQEISKLPSSLKNLKCEYNKLEYLNLNNLNELKTLHISNNLITVIENMPEGIEDFQKENLPSIEFRNSGEPEIKNKEENEKRRLKKDFYNDLKQYFKLKSKYEKKEKELKKNAYQKADTKKMAKNAVKKVKPPCIKCKRLVGTIFQKKNNTYTAICGDDTQPCKLNIKLYCGNYLHFDEGIDLFQNSLEDIKTNIIKQKMDNIFGYTDDETAKIKYEALLQDYNEEKDILQEMYDRRDEVYENLDKKEQVKNKKRELFTYIEDNKAILDEFKQTKNKQLIKDLVFNNVRNVHREARTISQIENEIIEMNYYKDENIYKVYKFPMLFHKSEINLGEPEVVKNFER